MHGLYPAEQSRERPAGGIMGSRKIGSRTAARGFNAELIPESDREPAPDTLSVNPGQVSDTPKEDTDKYRDKSVSCPFCNPAPEHILLSNDLCYARWDINPVSRGHLLIIPYRHVSDFFDTTAEERYAIMDLVTGSRAILQEQFHPSGYNFGVNAGEAAGQVIGHVHFHLIPRYHGDAGSKPNGMRNVVPGTPLRQHKLREYFHPPGMG